MSERQDETQELASRFLGVFEAVWRLAKHRQPDPVVGQLHLNQLHSLGMLHREPGLTQKDLAERLQITPAAISTAVRQMERYGLIERNSDDQDGRVKRLYLSADGRARIERAHYDRCSALYEILNALPIEEQRMVVGTLERAIIALQENQSQKS